MESTYSGHGVVRQWHVEDGWGVVDIRGHVGGCFVHFSNIEAPENTFRELTPGQSVGITWELGETDGYPARAIHVTPDLGT